MTAQGAAHGLVRPRGGYRRRHGEVWVLRDRPVGVGPRGFDDHLGYAVEDHEDASGPQQAVDQVVRDRLGHPDQVLEATAEDLLEHGDIFLDVEPSVGLDQHWEHPAVVTEATRRVVLHPPQGDLAGERSLAQAALPG